MMKKNKMIWILDGNYNGDWECLTAEESRREIVERRKEYEQNEPATRLRIRQVRE